jgi:hypothetical protein
MSAGARRRASGDVCRPVAVSSWEGVPGGPLPPSLVFIPQREQEKSAPAAALSYEERGETEGGRDGEGQFTMCIARAASVMLLVRDG